MYALTAIDWTEIEDLLRHGVKTYELVCADHITIAKKTKKKDKLFITNLSKQDVKAGLEGVITEVQDITTGYWRTVPREYDEKELLTARVQVKYLNDVRVTKVKDKGKGEGLTVEIKEHMLLG